MKPRIHTGAWRPGLAALATMATVLCQAAPVPGQGTWESTLHARDLDGDGTADADYDSVLDITWLRDWGLSGSAGYWSDAFDWADALVVGGHAGWRLPSATDLDAPGCDFAMAGTDCGFNNNPAASEYAHLYFVTLGNLSYHAPGDDLGDPPQPGWGLTNTAHFEGLQVQSYWTGTAVATDPLYRWTFGMAGGQGTAPTFSPDIVRLATAVHDGDIGTPTAVSAPPSLALALAGLALLAAGRPGRRARRLWDTAGPP